MDQTITNKENDMDDAARRAKNAYRRRWAKANPEKVRAQQMRYWRKRAAREAAEAAAQATEQDA